MQLKEFSFKGGGCDARKSAGLSNSTRQQIAEIHQNLKSRINDRGEAERTETSGGLNAKSSIKRGKRNGTKHLKVGYSSA